MKSNIFTVMQKEFARFFGDKRMLIMLLLPAILIYVLYSFMGSAMQKMYMPDEAYSPKVYIANMPDSLKDAWQWAELLPFGTADIPDITAAKEKITLKEADLCVIFPVDFDTEVAAYDVQTSGGPAPNIEIYYNSTDTNSQNAYGIIVALLDRYENTLANKFDINRDIADSDTATEKDTAANIISSLMPMLLLIFLYSGCMSIATESIAGEKERGTIGALLVSPLKRSQLAIGKILSLGVLSFLSGLVTALAMILSLGKMIVVEGNIDVNIYNSQDYLCLALIILSTILLFVTLISIISAFAKTVKEATTTIMPLMIIVILAGISGMFSGGAQTDPIYYLIPIYNSVQAMSGVFSLDYSTINVIIAGLTNLVFACAGGFILTKMFNSEKVMFSK